jgi:glutathione synthase/RimK-type ligase-like ATP-grasp enzyme
MYDITILTAPRYIKPKEITPYIQNILTEAKLIREALEKRGLKVHRINWDDPDFDWSSTKYVLFRTTWDYFDRFEEFEAWMKKVEQQTQLINPSSLLYWNIDKHYLLDLEEKGLPIPATIFIEPGDEKTLVDWVAESGWKELILKPAISGAARHTYRFLAKDAAEHEAIFRALIAKESMLLQEFQHQVLTKGEVAFMAFGGKYSHAVLKRAKAGDFRVQDDFGGTLHPYEASEEEIALVEQTLAAVEPLPAYARVDVIWDNEDRAVISELELVEPELWFRRSPEAADLLAEHLVERYFS